MQCEVDEVHQLVFGDGAPVQAASAVTRLGEGWLVIQDDATSAAWWRGETISRVQVFPPVEGHETFSEAAGTKHLKPDLEAACAVDVNGATGVLLLGSGSHARRMRAALVTLLDGQPQVSAADLSPLYEQVAGALGIGLDDLNLEGACVLGDRLRWFQRGNGASGIQSASLDLPLAALLDQVHGGRSRAPLEIGEVLRYDLGELAGVKLAVTDAVALPDGRVLVSAAAEDTDNAVDDGDILGAAIALLDGADVLSVGELPNQGGTPWKVEGLGLRAVREDGVDILAVVDQDTPAEPSLALTATLRW